MNLRPMVLLPSVFLVSISLALPSDDRAKKLPEKHREWLEEEVNYIITDVERDAFLNLEAEEQREAFVDAFWRKRDTNPTTLENEFRDEHYERLAYANEFLGRETFRPGWMTDQGRYFIVLGPPRDVQNFEGKDKIYPAELWFYNNPELKQYGLPPFFYLLFFRRHGSGELELYSPAVDGPKALLSGYTGATMDLRENVEQAYNTLWEISPELADASLSFRTDEGDIVDFQAPAWGTASLLNQIAVAPFRGVDTSYAERFDIEKGLIESDYLFRYFPSWGDTSVLPGPDETYYLHWIIEMDPQSIAMVHDQDRDLFGALFILSAEIAPRGDSNKVLVNLRKESFMNLTDSQAEPQLRLPFAYSGMFPIIKGSYDVRIILRNRACASRDESSCLKSYTVLESQVVVPEWDAVKPRLSQVVLAYGTEWHSDKSLYRPYRLGNLQILPNPRRVYAIGDSLVAMTEPLAVEPGSRVRFRIVSLDARDKVLLERAVTVETFRLQPLVQELELQGFLSGHYQLVVDLLDPSDNAVIDTRTSDFDVTPRTVVPRPSVRGSWLQVVPEVPGMVKMALGDQYLSLEDKETARKHFEASVAANPRLCPTRVSLGALLLEEDDVEGVIEMLEPKCSAEDRYEPLALLGEAYFRKQDYTKSSELLEKAFVLRRSDTRLLNSLAVSLYHLGNPERARELLERSLSLDPDQSAIKELLEKIESG